MSIEGEAAVTTQNVDSPGKKKETTSRKSSVGSSSSRPAISRKLVRQATMKDLNNHNVTKSEKNATAAITHTPSLILAHGQDYRFGEGIDCTRLFVEYEVKQRL